MSTSISDNPRARLLPPAVGAVLLLVCSAPRSATAQISPGKLSAAHAVFDGVGNCDTCHIRRKQTPPARCFACHKVLAARVRANRGSHASRGRSRCGRCHQEHRGRSFQIVHWPGGQAGFKHGKQTGFRLAGAHGKLKCRRCHRPRHISRPAVKRFKAARQRRTFLGLSRACKSCHVDVHAEGRRISAACDRCHDERRFKPAARFDHRWQGRYRLAEKHIKVDCRRCHRRKDAKGRMRFFERKFSRCADCHPDPHRGAMTSKKTSRCEVCHDERGFLLLRYDRGSHAPKTFRLRNAHGKPRCVACHGPKAALRRTARCADCHKDVHRRRFGGACGRCHGDRDWKVKGVRLGRASSATLSAARRVGIPAARVRAVAFHDRARYKLDGKHVVVACKKCHRGRRGYRRYRGRQLKFDRCDRCHEDPHLGTLARLRIAGPRAHELQPCRRCHTTASWRLTSFDVKRHGSESRYPLEGAHRVVACDRCHDKKTRRERRRFVYVKPRCEVCHRDPHGGQFLRLHNKKHRRLGCAGCHEQRRFSPIRRRFDHAKTSFPLEGAHGKARCRACHRRSPASKGAPPVVYRGLSRVCGDCHRDRHQGQFALRAPKRSCDHCHGVATFKLKRVDHKTLASYALEGKHRKATCAACHKPVKLRRVKAEVLRYRPTPKRCGGCHISAHRLDQKWRKRHSPQVRAAVLRATAGRVPVVRLTDCGRCHGERGWVCKEKVSGFDHRRVGYTLEGAHRQATCGRCHPAGRRARRACKRCHKDTHGGRLGLRCENCHRTGSWRTRNALARHRQTRFSLTGSHALADCGSCHPQARRARFRGVPSACVACHDQQYRSSKTHPNHLTSGFSSRCERCHRTGDWSPAYFRHDRYPLTGKHRGVACSGCHKPGRKTPRTCVGCHDGDRKRARSPDHLAAGFSTLCQTCHTTRGWKPATFGDHDRYFPISYGKHRRFACGDCHKDTSSYKRFICLEPCHRRDKMDRKHRNRSGYLYESRACLRCHPKGRGD